MLVSGLRDESLANLVSGSDVKFADVHKSLRECAQAIRDRYQQKQAKNTVKRRIKTDAIKVLLEELCNVPEDFAAIRETISSALERHVEALRNHEHLLSKKGNTYALLQQTRGLRMGHGDAPAELAPLLQYHDLKDKLLASDSPLSAEKKEVITMLDTKKGLTLTVLESMDELSRDEATGRLSYIYNGRNFPLQGSSSRGLPENFICCICLNIINQPREVCSESHITCLECAINLKEREDAVCPQCRKSPLAKLKESTAIERSIGNLQVHCCNDGCRSVMPISEIKSHLGLCDEEEIKCPGNCIDESTNEVLNISAALKSHVAALQGHEHLLSEKGNNYALMEQTRSFFRRRGDAPASLLRYHDLKNKVLVPDETLSPEDEEAMRKAISELSAKKGLTLGILEVIERKPRTSGLVLGELYKADMLEPDLCTWVFKQEDIDIAARMLVRLHQGNLFREDARRMAYAHRNPIIAAKALVELNKADLLDSEWCARVLEHDRPYYAATALLKLEKAGLLESEWCTRVLVHSRPDKAATALLELAKEGLLDSGLLAKLLEYTNPDEAAIELIEVKKITEAHVREASSENEKVELLYEVLVTLMHDKRRDFFIALQSNDSDNIETVTRERVMLTPNFPVFLIRRTDPVVAFIPGSACIVSVFPLSEMQKGELLCRLLASSNSADDDISGFHLALQNGHAKFIATFIRESAKAIGEFHLPEAQQAELLRNLLASKRADGTPGLYMALYNNHANAIFTFIHDSMMLIRRLSLPKAEKIDLLYELLISKAANGRPGFYMALRCGNYNAITAFISGILVMTILSESKEESAELLYGLLHSMESASTTDFLLALEQGGPEVKEAFTQGIDRLPLSEKQKEALKHPALKGKGI